MDKDKIVQFTLDCKKEVEDERKDVKKVWDECWDMYRNYQDYSKKEDWQHQVYVGESFAAIKKATSIIRSALVQGPQYFGIEGRDEQDKIKAEVLYSLVDYWYGKAKFLPNFFEAVESGFVLGDGIIKQGWEEKDAESVEAVLSSGNEEETSGEEGTEPTQTETDIYQIQNVSKKQSSLSVKVVDPYTLFYPDSQRFKIERYKLQLWELRQLVESGKGGYNKKEFKNLFQGDYVEESGRDSEDNERLERLGLMESQNKFRKEVLIYEFWGDLTDEDGKLIQENCTFHVANEKYLIKSVRPNPYWHKKDPYTIFSPLNRCFRKTGISMLEGVRTIQTAINDNINMMLDGLLFELLGFLEMNPEALHKPVSKILPGQPLLVKKIGEAFNYVHPNAFDPDALQMIQVLKDIFQNVTAVTHFLMGTPTAKGEKTATEVTTKTREGEQTFYNMAMEIEQSGLSPCVEMTGALVLQFMDEFSDPSITRLLNEKGLLLQSMPREQRYFFMQGNYDYKGRGISIYFERREKIQRIIDFLTVIGKTPLVNQFNWQEFAKVIVENFGFTGKDLIMPPAPPIPQIGMGQQPGAAPPPGTGAPAAPGMPGPQPMPGPARPPAQPPQPRPAMPMPPAQGMMPPRRVM